jgi:cellulose synthase/poly-beta-1,6-N-acetylglucosamine synthase-like glycosyltransferase
MLRDDDLPRYAVLVALYHEVRILPQLVKALTALDFPSAKLDIKLILEEVDTETIACARAMKLPPQFEILVVPDGAPRTKPRALNYALQFARGELLVVYDAEDRPDPQQLRMAATRFASAPEEVVCLQAQLAIDNFSQNWLAKQFTIEYASLFGGILPLLDRIRMPIPLGGTSNHFRIDNAGGSRLPTGQLAPAEDTVAQGLDADLSGPYAPAGAAYARVGACRLFRLSGAFRRCYSGGSNLSGVLYSDRL